jgi:hypothetical protein
MVVHGYKLKICTDIIVAEGNVWIKAGFSDLSTLLGLLSA